MERRSDRALPSISTTSYRWLRTVPIFAALMTASVLAIFNYQKQSSSVVSSTMYALRTNAQAREILGDEIYFAHQIPWISGEINQLHGRIDISFWVKGTRGRGRMRFRSLREGRMGAFETLEWSLEPEGGRTISLLESQGRDPFLQATADKIAVAA
jgi:cytochrome c oxidase assembly factor 1